MLAEKSAASAQPGVAVTANLRWAFILVTSLFFMWGLSYGLLDVLNKHFQETLHVTKAQSGLLQAAYFGAYFLVALPAGYFMDRKGYKAGILVGLCLYALGALLFVPAASANSFGVFLFALFVIASGLGCLETAANPYATVLGDAQGAERRLNLAQSFNGLGQFIGPLIGGTLFWWFTARELRRRDIHGALRPRLFNVARRIEGAWNFVWTTNIAHTIWAARNSCTTVLVGVVIGPAAAGLFKIAMTFFDATGTPAKLLEKSFYPEIMRLDPRTKTPWLLGLRSSLLAGGIGLAVAVLMLLVGKPLISAVFGQQYLEAYDLIQIMLGAIIVSMMGFPQESLLFMAGKQRAFLIAQATASAAYIALLVSMAYAFGVQGAAFAYLLGQCLDVLLSLIPTIGAYRNRFILALNAPKESNQ